MKKLFINIRDFVIAAAVGAGSMAIYMLFGDMLGIEPTGWFSIIVVVIVALFITVTIHEIGHLMAGKAVGFKFYMLTVGPFKIQRKGDRLQAGINRHLNIGGG